MLSTSGRDGRLLCHPPPQNGACDFRSTPLKQFINQPFGYSWRQLRFTTYIIGLTLFSDLANSRYLRAALYPGVHQSVCRGIQTVPQPELVPFGPSVSTIRHTYGWYTALFHLFKLTRLTSVHFTLPIIAHLP